MKHVSLLRRYTHCHHLRQLCAHHAYRTSSRCPPSHGCIDVMSHVYTTAQQRLRSRLTLHPTPCRQHRQWTLIHLRSRCPLTPTTLRHRSLRHRRHRTLHTRTTSRRHHCGHSLNIQGRPACSRSDTQWSHVRKLGYACPIPSMRTSPPLLHRRHRHPASAPLFVIRIGWLRCKPNSTL